MSLSIGIVGLPNVGKSTLFNSLTKKSVPAENYPFCTIDPSVGVVAVPDERLERLSRLSNSRKTIPAAVQFVDIAGLVAGAAEGAGLGNKFLAYIREVDAIAHVVRVFGDTDVVHVSGKVAPLADIEVVNLELVLADLETVSKRLAVLEKEAKAQRREALWECAALQRARAELESGRFIAEFVRDAAERALFARLNLLTAKPMLYVFNISAADGGESVPADLCIALRSSVCESAACVLIDPIFGSGLDALVAKAYEMLGLSTFFTTGEDETRAWTIRRGSTAPEAGAAIHGDFRDKFIRAEVIRWDSLLEAGSRAAARERGLVRIEGKEYAVQDGDVIEFKI